VRHEVARLVHEVDAQLIVLDADVHVHAADDESPAHPGKVACDGLVAVALGGLLRAPTRKRVRGGGDRGEAVLVRQPRHRHPQIRQFPTRFARRPVHAGADLDLRFQELARDPLLQCRLRGIEQRLRHVAHQIAARLIDEEVLLLDADGERRVLQGHDSHGGIEIGAIQTTPERPRPAQGWQSVLLGKNAMLVTLKP